MKKLKIWKLMFHIVIVLPMIVSCGGDDNADREKETNDIEKTKEWIEGQRQLCYILCSEFVDDQIKLEQIRTNPSKVHSLTPTSDEIEKTWDIALRTIMLSNAVLENLERYKNLYSNQDYNSISIHPRAIRAFVYYNMAMLWGDVPLAKTLTSDFAKEPQSKQLAIYTFVKNEIDEIAKIVANLNLEYEGYITKDAIMMMKAGIELTLKNAHSALAALNQIERKKYEEAISKQIVPLIWGMNPPYAIYSCYVYTYSHIMLYEQEILGKTENLETLWKSEYTEYGYWAALKRLGKAQAVTGCYDYELIMPLPNSYIKSSKKAVQNTGYTF